MRLDTGLRVRGTDCSSTRVQGFAQGLKCGHASWMLALGLSTVAEEVRTHVKSTTFTDFLYQYHGLAFNFFLIFPPCSLNNHSVNIIPFLKLFVRTQLGTANGWESLLPSQCLCRSDERQGRDGHQQGSAMPTAPGPQSSQWVPAVGKASRWIAGLAR